MDSWWPLGLSQCNGLNYCPSRFRLGRLSHRTAALCGLWLDSRTKVLRQALPHRLLSSYDALGRPVTLPESPVGAQLRVTGVRLAAVDAFRLSEMGIRLGTLAHVTQHAAFGGRVIAVSGSRFALDGATAALIDVEPVEHLG